jgi:hypothetical protein
MFAPRKYDFILSCVVSELVPTFFFDRCLYPFSNIPVANTGPVSGRWNSVDVGCIADFSEILSSPPQKPMTLVNTHMD